MKQAVAISELATLTPQARDARLAGLVRDLESPPNGELRSIEQQIAVFEARFGFASEELGRRLSAGTGQETWEVCEWTMLLDLRSHLASLTSRAGQAPDLPPGPHRAWAAAAG